MYIKWSSFHSLFQYKIVKVVLKFYTIICRGNEISSCQVTSDLVVAIAMVPVLLWDIIKYFSTLQKVSCWWSIPNSYVKYALPSFLEGLSHAHCHWKHPHQKIQTLRAVYTFRHRPCHRHSPRQSLTLCQWWRAKRRNEILIGIQNL